MDGVDHKHYEEYVDLRGDGRIVMYKRKDHSKRPKWNVRLKIPNTKGYVVKSTKTTDFNEGKRFSEDLYYELEGKVRRGETLKSPPFSKVVDEFIETQDPAVVKNFNALAALQKAQAKANHARIIRTFYESK